MFSCESREIFRNISIKRTPPVTASVNSWRPKPFTIVVKLSILDDCGIPGYVSDLRAAAYETIFLKQSQTYVAAWFFPVEYDQIKLSITSEKRFVEHPFPKVIVLSLNK